MSKKRSLDISAYRQEIDQIDQVIAQLLEERVLRAQEIMTLKKTTKLPLLDRRRESEILKLYFKQLKKVSSKPRTRKLTQAIIALNPKYPVGPARSKPSKRS